MLTAVIGLLGAVVYGSADFLGGLASRRISPLRVTAIGAVSGLVGLLVALLVVGGRWSASAVGWGALSGVTGAAAISLLYACLAIGPMSILSPLTAVVSAVVPMTWGLLGGERLAPIGFVALGSALVAVVLVGFVPEKGAVRPRPRGLLMAVCSGTLIGVFLILVDQTPDDSGLVPLVLNRTVNGAIMFTTIGVLALLARRRRARANLPAPDARSGWLPGLGLAIACGFVDTAANVLVLFGLRAGDLSVMSVLIAMYPAGTILLAAVVLRERIAPVQWAGLALALAAAGMLAVA
ncbi:EamA family transporter [Leifsonia poae]|uniref:EamA family transporter n=1 Tax=Leifsonia poae TaxID=110933 RepID=UPI001CBE2B09|nr:EamA family transporter [Leifsonia poae]